MKKIFTLLFTLVLTHGVVISQQNWSIVSTNNSFSAPQYLDVDYSASNIWHLCGEDGTIKLSDNYGQTWTDANQGINSTHKINTIEFANSTLGFAGGVTTTLQFGNFGKLYYTTDGGKSWIDYNVSSSVPRISAIHFPSFYRGYAVANNRILRARNAGSTWSFIYTYGSIELFDIHFADSMFGMACGELGSITKTDDGGQSWGTVYWGPHDDDIYGIYLLSKNVAIACGENGFMARTTNGGLDWTEYNINTSRDLTSIHFFNSQEGIVVGDGLILYTSNGGATFNSLPTPTSRALNSIVMLNSKQAIAVGDNETILKYGNLGLSNQTVKPVDDVTMRVYPNPAINTINISIKEGYGENATVNVYDMTGKLLESKTHNFLTDNATLDISNLKSGMYSIKVFTKETTYTQQLVKQ